MNFTAAIANFAVAFWETDLRVLTVAGIIAICLAFLVQRLILHPLAKYPGPLLGRCTTLYAAYHAWNGSLHTDMYRCHQKYGPVVRYSPSRLLINTNTAMKEISAYSANTMKSKAYQAMVHGATNTLTIRHKGEHARRRKLLSLAFSEARMMSYENIIQRNINSLCQNLELCAKSQGATLNLSPQTSIQARNRFLSFIGSLLRGRAKANFEADGDVLSFLETAKGTDGDSRLSKAEIRAECVTLVVAGSDTTSAALSSTLFYLSRNEHAYERLCREIRDRFQSRDQIRIGPQLNTCTYLRACIDEALRMSPPAGGALWREIAPGGMIVNNLTLPPGLDVGVGIYSLHHNEEYHPEPFKYRPERWIVGEFGVSKESLELARSAFVPFSSGPRGCLGKSFAYHQLTLVLANIICGFDFYAADRDTNSAYVLKHPGGNEEFLLKDHITGAKDGPILNLKMRENL
ncbi:hypothetical protein G7054_g568 [Neopestalotiopsis clavispora]|nr:hypothetical protein G7054_g568 [Neopestalotiopsis clavispora]